MNFSIYHQMKQGSTGMKFTKDKHTQLNYEEKDVHGKEKLIINDQILKKRLQHYLHF